MQDRVKYPRTPKDLDHIDNYQALKANWQYSCANLESMSSRLRQLLDARNISVVVAGSYGRMDACAESDLDYMILVEEKDARVEEVRTAVESMASAMGIPLPNKTGVFSEIIPIGELISKTGSAEDDIRSLAQRMLLLMECKPLYNESLFRNTVDRLLRKYLELVIEDPSKEALFLLNETIRYFRTICVNYQFNFWKEEDKWVMRNVKLRHSRVIMYGSLLLLILNASKRKTGKFEYIANSIYLTPIEKIVQVYRENEDGNYSRVVGVYDIFLKNISDPEVRQALKVDYEERYQNPHYSMLKVLSDSLQTELTRFIFAQRGRWTEQIYEYLLF